MVAQVSSNKTSESGNATRQGSRSSPICENSLRRTATRDRSLLVEYHRHARPPSPTQERRGNHNQMSTQNRPSQPVNLSSQPWARSAVDGVEFSRERSEVAFLDLLGIELRREADAELVAAAPDDLGGADRLLGIVE